MSVERQAARSLHRDVEAVWERLRAEFALNEGFWLGFLFGAQAADVAELVARSRDLARAEVRRVEVLTLARRDGAAEVLARLLAPHAPDLAATWVLDDEAAGPDRAGLWSALLRRLNERRDALLARHPAGLVLVCPAGSLPQVRDDAPDLWSFRSLTATVDTASDSPVPVVRGEAEPQPDVRGNPLAPVPRDPIRASAQVAPLLQRAASALRANRADLALDAGLEALRSARNEDDRLLAHAWLAQVRADQGEPVEAARHARTALAGRRPLELATTVELLEILARSVDRDVALQAATALVDVRRELVQRHPESPEALRDLSVSLNNVGGVQQYRGQLDDALAAYTESLHLRRRIHTSYGESPEALRDLSVSLNNVGGVQERRGQLDDALAAYTEAFDCYRRLESSYGAPLADPEERDQILASIERVRSR